MTDQIERSRFITDGQLEFLDELNEQNFTFALGCLMDAYDGELEYNEAEKILAYWMEHLATN